MGIMKVCPKCSAVACICGFVATVVVSLSGDSKPPPPRVVGPIVAPLATGTITTTMGTYFLTVPDENTGKEYSAVWSDKQRQRELAYSTASIAGSLDGLSPLSLRDFVIVTSKS